MHHFIQRRRDEAGKTDDIDLLRNSRFEDLGGRHHHAEIDDLVIVAGENDADDVLADIVDIALHRRHQHLAGRLALIAAVQALFLFHIGKKNGNGLLHHTGGFDHLRQEHLARTEEIADHIHARHQRTFDDMQRTGRLLARLFRIRIDVFGDAIDQRMLQPLFNGEFAPRQILNLALLGTCTPVTFGNFKQPFGRVGVAVQHHIFASLAQFRIDALIDRKLARIDDAHIHADLDRMIQEHGMHRLTHRLVAAEGEGQIRDTAGNMHERHGFADGLGGLDEIDAVIIVLFDTGRNGKHIRVEDNVFGQNPGLLRQELVGARADLNLALVSIGLPHFVKSHDDDGSAVIAHQTRLLEKLLLAFLQRDGVDDRLALNAFQASLDDLPFGAVDHHRHAGNIRLGGNQIEKLDHGLLAVDQALIHVDVDDLCAVLHLIAGDGKCSRIVASRDQLAELGRARHVRALADIDEGNVLGQHERLEAGQRHEGLVFRHLARLKTLHGVRNGANMLRRRAAAAAHHIDQSFAGKLGNLCRHHLRRFVILAELVRQAGIRIGADEGIGHIRQFLQMRTHSVCAKRTVQADGKRVGVTHRVPEGRRRLARQRAAGKVGDRAGDHHWQMNALGSKALLAGEDRGLGVQRVEDGFNKDEVGTTIDQAVDLLTIGETQIIEADGTVAGIVYIRRDRRGAVGRADGTGDETAAAILALGALGGATHDEGALAVEVIDRAFHLVIGLRDARGRKRVGLQNIRPRHGVAEMDILDRIRLRQDQKVVIALLVTGTPNETITAEVVLVKSKALDLRAHGTIENEDALFSRLFQRLQNFRAVAFAAQGAKQIVQHRHSLLILCKSARYQVT